MYDETTRARILRRLDSGISLNQLSRQTGVSRAAIRSWKLPRTTPPLRSAGCCRCEPAAGLDHSAYAHLLGLYLGDGCLSRNSKAVYALRISCDAKYGRLIDEAEESVRRVRPGIRVYQVLAPGVVVVQAYWKHWPCLFPQHGPGKKHERPILLADWQREIVAAHPGPLARGLFHSDGCRITNWTVRRLKAGPKRYEYPRYLFSNRSEDIIDICTDALDRLEVRWTRSRRDHVSVARRDDVARLDCWVGPKS